MPMGTHLFLFMLLGLGFYLISALAAKLIPAIDFWIDIVLWVGLCGLYLLSSVIHGRHCLTRDNVLLLLDRNGSHCFRACGKTFGRLAGNRACQKQNTSPVRHYADRHCVCRGCYFFIYGPDPSPLKYVILFGMISGGGALVKRILNVFSVRFLFNLP